MGVALASILLNVAAFLLACTVLSGPVRSAILTEEAVEELEINRGAPMRPPAAAVSSWRGSGRGAAALVQAAFSRKISDTTVSAPGGRRKEVVGGGVRGGTGSALQLWPWRGVGWWVCVGLWAPTPMLPELT